MQQININNELLIPQCLSDGSYTWTLTSRLGNMLEMAEELFGPRDPSYTILGIEFVSNGPYAWYRGSHRRHIIIRLNLEASTDMWQACYQMAHETIHLLAPTGGKNSTNFEEGVACYFAAYYMKNGLNAPDWKPDLLSYKRVLKQVAPLLDADLDCVHRLRKQEPSFSKMSKELISGAFPNLTSENVNFLISKFDRNSS